MWVRMWVRMCLYVYVPAHDQGPRRHAGHKRDIWMYIYIYIQTYIHTEEVLDMIKGPAGTQVTTNAHTYISIHAYTYTQRKCWT